MVLIQYAYDGLNQLIREDNAVLGKIYTFTYDTAGNITEKKILNRTALGVGVLEQTIPYEYAATGWRDRLTSYNGESITYDALGNPTTYRGHNLTWGKIKQRWCRRTRLSDALRYNRRENRCLRDKEIDSNELVSFFILFFS